jgi:hypothetical protein
LNPVVATLRRQRAAPLRCLMNDRPAFHEFGKTAEKWRDLAEKRRQHFAELCRSGRWQQLYRDEDKFLARLSEIAAVCDRWAAIIEDHRQLVAELDDQVVTSDAA